VNEFVEECRGEWKRLGVPDRVADEMAAELAADLEEAEAEGVSAGEVLGTGVFDAPSFAAEWATERGVTKQPPPRAQRAWRTGIAAAIPALAAIVISGAVLLIVTSPSAPKRLSLPGPAAVPSLADVRMTARVYEGPPLRVTEQPIQASAQPAMPPTIWVGALPPNAAAVEIRIPGEDDDTRTVAWVLTIVGVAGGALLALLWLGDRQGPWPRGRTREN
jgi:hypothetical protein